MTNPITPKEQTDSSLASLPTDVLINILATLSREEFLETTFNLLQTASVFYKLRDNSNFWSLAYSHAVSPLSLARAAKSDLKELFTKLHTTFQMANKKFIDPKDHLANIMSVAHSLDTQNAIFLLKKLVARKSDFLQPLSQNEWQEIRNSILEDKTEHLLLALIQNPATFASLIGISKTEKGVKMAQGSEDFISDVINQFSAETASVFLEKLEELYNGIKFASLTSNICAAVEKFDATRVNLLSFEALLMLRRFSKRELNETITNLLIKNTREKFISYLINNKTGSSTDFPSLNDLLEDGTITYNEILTSPNIDIQKFFKFIKQTAPTLKDKMLLTFFKLATSEAIEESLNYFFTKSTFHQDIKALLDEKLITAQDLIQYSEKHIGNFVRFIVNYSLSDKESREALLSQFFQTMEKQGESQFFPSHSANQQAKLFLFLLKKQAIKFNDNFPGSSQNYAAYLHAKKYFGCRHLEQTIEFHIIHGPVKLYASMRPPVKQAVSSLEQLKPKQQKQQAMLDNADSQLNQLSQPITTPTQASPEPALDSETLHLANRN